MSPAGAPAGAEETDADRARQLLGSTAHQRLHVVVAARWAGTGATDETARLVRRHGAPASSLVPGDQRREHFRQGDGHAPRLLACRCVRRCPMPGTEETALVHGRHKWLFGLPSGALVGVLTIDFEPRDAVELDKSVRAILGDVRDGADLQLDGAGSLLEGCIAAAPAELRKCVGTAHGSVDSHRLLLLTAGAPGMFTRDGAVRRDAIAALGSESGLAYRTDHSPSVTPKAPNRFAHTHVEVRPGMTVAAGQEPWRQVRMLFAVLESFASLAVLHGLRQQAREQLDALRGHGAGPAVELDALREELAYRAERLTELQLDLSFGVESYLHPRLLFADLPVQEYHSALIDLLQLPHAADGTARVLERLGAALDGRRLHIDAEERDRDERRRQRWSAGAVALASTAVPLALVLAYLGASIKEVEAANSIFDRGYVMAYAVLLGVVLLGACIAFGWLWLSGRADASQRKQIRERLRREQP